MSRQYPEHPRVGVGAVIWKNGLVLLIKRAAPPRQNMWSLPGGMQQLGETLAEAILREIKEETGLVVRLGEIVEVIDLIERDQAGRVEYHFTVVDYEADWDFGQAVAADDALEAVWADPLDLASYELTPQLQSVIAKALSRRRNSIVL
jgi:mutator protein MutT